MSKITTILLALALGFSIGRIAREGQQAATMGPNPRMIVTPLMVTPSSGSVMKPSLAGPYTPGALTGFSIYLPPAGTH
jgi:hypothetical protein